MRMIFVGLFWSDQDSDDFNSSSDDNEEQPNDEENTIEFIVKTIYAMPGNSFFTYRCRSFLPPSSSLPPSLSLPPLPPSTSLLIIDISIIQFQRQLTNRAEKNAKFSYENSIVYVKKL